MQTYDKIDSLLLQCTLADPPCASIAASIELLAISQAHPIVLNYLLQAAKFARNKEPSKAAACLSQACSYFSD